MKRQSELRSVTREHPSKSESRYELTPFSSEFGSIMSTLGSMERLLEESVRRPFWAPFSNFFREFGRERGTYYHPTVDMFERGNEIIVRCEVPGMKREDLEVKFTDDSTLVISGEKRFEENIEEENYWRHESSYGSFKRIVELPEACEHDKVKASYTDGILEIHVPKSEKSGKVWNVAIE